MADSEYGIAQIAWRRGQKAKGALGPSGIVKGIPPRLNKKSKTFNWAGGVNLRSARLEAKSKLADG